MTSTEALIEWEQQLALLYRQNPYDAQISEREKRHIEKKLYSKGQGGAYASAEERVSMIEPWLAHYAPHGRPSPVLWQRFYLCLLRFVLDADARAPQPTPETAAKLCHRLLQIGHHYGIPEAMKLLEIAERARLAKIAMNRLRGASRPLHDLKRAIWSACFGQDLIRLLVYERLLQELNVVILGETGTGKELVAQVLLAATNGLWDEHKRGHLFWRTHRTEALNLAEFPRELMAAQIVGYKRGAFTGADQDFRGVLARCNQGAVFLDEIGELPEEGQVILLRALETRQIRPLGSPSVEFADVRVITATHRDLDELQTTQRFRRDLYFRLAGSILRIPPLRERRDDILPIALGFLDEWGLRTQASLHLEDPRLHITQWLQSDEISHYTWPGNVRELKRTIAQILLGQNNNPTAPKPDPLLPAAALSPSPDTPLLPLGLLRAEWTMDEVKQWYLAHALDRHQGNQNETARKLGIHRTTIYHARRKQDRGVEH